MSDPADLHRNGVSDIISATCIEQIAGAANILIMVEELKREENQALKEKNEALIKIRKLENQLLVDDILYKNKMEIFSKRILDLERELDARKKVEEVKRKFVSKKRIKEKDIAGDESKVEVLQIQLEEKQEDINNLQDFNQALIVRERQVNHELQEARKVLIAEYPYQLSYIRIKRIGELNRNPFRDACKNRFPKEEFEVKASEVCSLWEERLKDSKWHPLKVVDIHGIPEEVVDEDDEKLRNLKEEWGDEVQEAVISAYKELNEYNPSGRYPVGELWNFKHDRKAPLDEVVSYLLKTIITQKRKRR